MAKGGPRTAGRGEVRVTKRDGAQWIVMDWPSKQNALSKDMYVTIGDAIADAAGDSAIDVIVLSGAGSVFSSGGDLNEVKEMFADREHLEANFLATYARCVPVEMMITVSKPVVSMVRGACHAGGFGLAMASDILVASETARFGMAEGRVGMWDHFLPSLMKWKVGIPRSQYLTLTGRSIDGRTAQEWGIAALCVPDDELEDAVGSLIRDIQRCSPESRAAYKQTFTANPPLLMDWRPVIRAGLSHNAAEGLDAFMERRAPQWKKIPGPSFI